MKFKEVKLCADIKYRIIIVFADNKKALIIKPHNIRKILGDYEVLCFYTMEDYINEEYSLYIHLNISSKDYKKILGY